MIRTETEYQSTLQRIQEGEEHLRRLRESLAAKGRGPGEIKRATDPAFSFQEQLREEAESYERLRRGDFEELRNFEGTGRLLIALRIYQGLSQRELADKLGVHESQVSRDERNEYHGITVERANRILEALGAELRTNIVTTPHKAKPAKGESVLVGG
jgi:ribosome-binding protein aMBF1 (putative translation factor)